MAKSEEEKASDMLLVSNIFLFLIKIATGILSNSIGLLSDAANSLGDIMTSIIIKATVRISGKKADESHPFGHYRAQPIGALFVAIVMGLIGFEIIKNSIVRIFFPEEIAFIELAIFALFVSIAGKGFIWLYLKKIYKEGKHPVLSAAFVDARNDIFMSLSAIIGIMLKPYFGTSIDSAVGIAIGLYIICSGVKIALENIDYLMGRSPDKEFLSKIRLSAKSVTGVISIHDVKAHYVGNYLHVEVHIDVDKKLSLKNAHTIGKQVERAVQEIEGIADCFVHIDPR